MTSHDDSNDRRYAVGQSWRYNHRDGEEGSLLHIGAMEDHPVLGTVYGIYLHGLEVKNPYIPGGVQRMLPHAPVSQETLDMSVTELVDIVIDPQGFEDGYGEWKREFDAGRAGVFTASVAEIVSLIERAVSGMREE
jgi:hypothetical protein